MIMRLGPTEYIPDTSFISILDFPEFSIAIRSAMVYK